VRTHALQQTALFDQRISVGRAPAGGLFNHLVGGHLQVSGTVMPMALAVLRLTTSSIALVDTEG
jgi:hypothetical protein